MKEDERGALKEAQAEYRKWEDSLEGVAYWLGDMPVPESLEGLIVAAVQKLPSEAREFVYYNCQFKSGDEDGVRIRRVPQARQPWLITLGEGYVDESLIIHGIAHAWLGHEHGPQCGELQITQGDEQAACDLARQWGFDGDGAACSAHVR